MDYYIVTVELSVTTPYPGSASEAVKTIEDLVTPHPDVWIQEIKVRLDDSNHGK